MTITPALQKGRLRRTVTCSQPRGRNRDPAQAMGLQDLSQESREGPSLFFPMMGLQRPAQSLAQSECRSRGRERHNLTAIPIPLLLRHNY